MERHDNIRHTLLTIVANERHFRLTAAAIRRIVYAFTGRGEARSGWNVGFRRQVGKLWMPAAALAGNRRPSFVLTDAGRARLDEALIGAPALINYDADAWLADAYCYLVPTGAGGER